MPYSLPRASVDLSETRQPNLYASSTIPLFIAFLCVGLRFWCRWRNAAGLWLDDWLILGSLTFGPNATEDAYIGLFACELTYTGIVVLVKSSILALYWRIFNRTNIKIPIGILATVVSMWGIAVVSVFCALK
ncbi:integral membrane protein [Penicillium herquei]|nr:integral membrane protein [Penicillium herquei]